MMTMIIEAIWLLLKWGVITFTLGLGLAVGTGIAIHTWFGGALDAANECDSH